MYSKRVSTGEAIQLVSQYELGKQNTTKPINRDMQIDVEPHKRRTRDCSSPDRLHFFHFFEN